MPIYAYHCDTCGVDFDRMLPMSEHATLQTCEHCGNVVRKTYTELRFTLSGDDWPSKAGRVNRQMNERSANAARRAATKERDKPTVTLVPNVDGERTDSWRDAQKLAASKGKDTISYELNIRKEETKS